MTNLLQTLGGTADHPARAPRRNPWLAVLGTARVELTLTTRSLTFWLVQLAVLASTLLVLMPDGFSGTFCASRANNSGSSLRSLLLLPLLALPGLQRLQGSAGIWCLLLPMTTSRTR